ncbi:hypothetical protein AB833_26160 [Chromatiales bacterium (ex Bugula neritina AB1)]|nr:hypothetical protein AB833_26160 [Chromatiales bacterium (ex Bugula neritina AB1)]
MNKQHLSRYFNQAIIVVALGFMALAFAYSVRAILSLAMPIWERELDWSRGDVSNIAAVTLVIMAVVAPLSGILLDRKGLRFTLLVGLIAVCASSILVSLAQSTPTLFIGFALMGGVGFGIVSTHIVAAAVARVFPDHVGFASGIATSGSSAGQFLIVPLIAVLLSNFSWQWGFAALGIGTALLIPFVWLIPDDNCEETDSPGTVQSASSSVWLTDLRHLMLSPVFHLLFWSYLLCGYTTTGVIETHLLPYADLCGFAPIPSASAYGLLSVVNLAGMIGIGWLADRVNRPLLLAGIYLVRGFTFWLLLNIGSSYENLLLFAVIFGIVDYSTVPVTTSLVSSHLGLRTVGFVMGLLTAGHQLGAAIGAGFGGYMFDKSETYDLVWGSSIVLSAIAGLLVFLMREKPPVPT